MPRQPPVTAVNVNEAVLLLDVVLMRTLVEAMSNDEGRSNGSRKQSEEGAAEREVTPDAPKKRSRHLTPECNGEVFCNGKRSPRDLSPAVVDGIPRSPRLDGGRRRKLVLHFDLRNTVLVADSVTNVAVEQALNAFLTGATWGWEEDGIWRWHSDTPSVKPPAPGYVTYYKYLERQLVRTPSERTALRLATGDFTSTPIGSIFRPHFERHMTRLKWNYDGDKAAHQLLTMSGTDGQLYHYILEAVYRLIYHLVDTRRDFALVIRTYGLDAENVLSSLAHGIKGNHPGFSRALNVPLNRTPGTIQRLKSDVIVMESYRPDSAQKELLTKLSHERDIYRFLSGSQGISGYVDDFNSWQAHNYNHHSGKPLWIDPYDKHHHHIIFDDNFRALDEDSIVDVRVFDKEETTRAYSLTKTQLSLLEDVCLVQADLLEGIDDKDYFLRKVELCEANYARMIKSNSFPV
ncbi:hypothetical protein BaRGS_00008811 [Batillaria attramentaria]|uniref:HNH nuclease domain-containing protein n=1 Tax=Batillaria attramentaria TaxID=370345 RepID=A0ABD0LLA5_9CAEN